MKTAALVKTGLILLVILVSSCSSEETSENEIEGNWTVISFKDFENSGSITKTEENTWMDYNNGDITVNFTLSDNSKGEISVTNAFRGDFRIGREHNLTVSNLYGTEINEPDWGRRFDAILLAESYEVKGNLLTIFYDSRKKGIVLEKLN